MLYLITNPLDPDALADLNRELQRDDALVLLQEGVQCQGLGALSIPGYVLATDRRARGIAAIEGFVDISYAELVELLLAHTENVTFHD